MFGTQTVTITREGATVDANVRDYIIAAVARGELEASILDHEDPTPDVIAARVAIALVLGEPFAEENVLFYAQTFPQVRLLTLLAMVVQRGLVDFWREDMRSDDLRRDIDRRLAQVR